VRGNSARVKHWKPDEEIVRAVPTPSRKPWPAGATAGLLVVAAGCVGVAVLLYKLAGPSDVFR
jgi:hypothetical protein